MLKLTFGKFTKWKMLKQLILKDIDVLVIGSLGIVAFISFFVGGVVSIQTALNLENPLLPKNLIGFAVAGEAKVAEANADELQKLLKRL